MHSGRCRFCFFSTLRERAFRTLPRRLDKGRKGRSDGDESWAQKRRPRSPPSQSQSTNGLRPFSSSFSGALFPQKNKLSLSLSLVVVETSLVPGTPRRIWSRGPCRPPRGGAWGRRRGRRSLSFFDVRRGGRLFSVVRFALSCYVAQTLSTARRREEKREKKKRERELRV